MGRNYQKKRKTLKRGRNKTKQNLNALRLGPHSTMKMQTNQKQFPLCPSHLLSEQQESVKISLMDELLDQGKLSVNTVLIPLTPPFGEQRNVRKF